MNRLFRALLAVVISVVATAAPARAAFHTYAVAEVFSSADGSVQFIRLHEQFGSSFQNAWAGQTLTSTDGVTTHSFTFPVNLPSSSTQNTDVLIATANFASLPGGVTPNYIIPNGFLFPTGSVTFAGFVSTVNYGTLPTDGQHSVNAAGGQIVNSPANFNGAHGSVNVPPGTCCIAAACSITVQVSCTGTWTSGGTCASNPCAPPPVGVCCAGVTCAASTAANCTGANKLFVSSPACNGTGNNASPCCRADFNHVNGISVQDIFDYLALWFTSSPLADFDGNGAGAPTVQSIFSFLAAWFAGC